MQFLKINKINNVYAHISTNHPSILGDLYNYFSVYVEGYKFMPKYKMGIWDGKVHFMERNGKFPIGLLKQVYKFLEINQLKPEIDINLNQRMDVTGDIVDITNEWMDDKFVPYHYQMEGAVKALKYGRCILEHATSAGKSLTMSMIIMYLMKKQLSKKTLILVPSVSLVKQLTNDFIDYGVPADFIGVFSGFQKDIEQPIIISNWQAIHKHKEFLSEFECIIVDEVHSMRGNVVRSVSEAATNAVFRIGCTGTMPANRADYMLVESTLGPVVHKITARELIDGGHAADIKIKIPYIEYSDVLKKEIKNTTYDIEKKFLESLDPRNNVIKVIVKKHLDVGQNALVLVDHIEHAHALVDKFSTIPNAEVYLITGDTKPDERERIRQYTNDNKNIVIVATYGVFSTGISIKRLHIVLFASAGKSKIKILQSIGRGLRLHKDKKGLILYDIGDAFNFSEKHLQERINIYTKAQFDLDVFEINLRNYKHGSTI